MAGDPLPIGSMASRLFAVGSRHPRAHYGGHRENWRPQCDCRVGLVTDIERSYVEHDGCHQEP